MIIGTTTPGISSITFPSSSASRASCSGSAGCSPGVAGDAVGVDDPLGTFHYLTMYLMTEPVAQTLDEFAEVRERVAKLGRFYEHRRARLSGAWVFLEALAAPRSLMAPEVIPWRPNRGIYVVIDEPLDAVEALEALEVGPSLDEYLRLRHTSHFPALLEVPGVAGLWSFGTRRWAFAKSDDPPPDPQAQESTRITSSSSTGTRSRWRRRWDRWSPHIGPRPRAPPVRRPVADHHPVGMGLVRVLRLRDGVVH